MTHRNNGGDFVQPRPVSHTRDERQTTRYHGNNSGQFVVRQDSSYRNKAESERCNYCGESGNWKKDCPSLRNKLTSRSNFSRPYSAKGVGCVANVRQSNPTPNDEQVNKIPTEGTASEGGSGCGVPGRPVEGQCFSESASGHVGEGYTRVLTACAVTRANSHSQVMDGSSANKRACPQIPNWPSTLDRDDFILAQKEDDGLTELRDGVLSGEELQRADQGYLSHDGLLNRKLVSLKD